MTSHPNSSPDTDSLARASGFYESGFSSKPVPIQARSASKGIRTAALQPSNVASSATPPSIWSDASGVPSVTGVTPSRLVSDSFV